MSKPDAWHEAHRPKFEEWMAREKHVKHFLRCGRTGKYILEATERAWKVWMAAIGSME